MIPFFIYTFNHYSLVFIDLINDLQDLYAFPIWTKKLHYIV